MTLLDASRDCRGEQEMRDYIGWGCFIEPWRCDDERSEF
jgi:hypothetical protein